MEITDFFFLGHNVIGPRICSKIEQKGVRNPMKLIGENSSKVYFVQKSKTNIFTLHSEGKETPFGKHIVSKRKQITVDEFQSFLKELSELVLPAPKKGNRFTDKQVEDIIRMVMEGYTSDEIAKKIGVKTTAISSKIYQLRSKNLLPSKEECRAILKEKNKGNGNVEEKGVVNNSIVERQKQKAFIAKDIVCQLLSTGIMHGSDKEIAIRACNIAEEILKRSGL
jgi:predicted DNA-binding protein YlxM (UPF0122 family)